MVSFTYLFIYLFLSSAGRKVFSKLNFQVSMESVKRIVHSSSGVIEPILRALKERIEEKLEHPTENIHVCMDICYI